MIPHDVKKEGGAYDSPERKVLEEALNLPPIERAEIVEKLLASFEFSDRNAVDELWAKEAESRLDAYERGEINAIPAKDVFKKIEQRKG